MSCRGSGGVLLVGGARDAGATAVALVGWVIVLCVSGRAWPDISHQRTRVCVGAVGWGRLGCRGMYSRRVTRMMGSLATARLGSIS